MNTSFTLDAEKRSAVRSMLENWPPGGIVALTPRQMIAVLDAFEKLEKFKTYVHKRLDKAGVPTDPEPIANAQHGCRVEGRLNWLVRHMDDAVSVVGKLEQRLELANRSLETEGLPRV